MEGPREGDRAKRAKASRYKVMAMFHPNEVATSTYPSGMLIGMGWSAGVTSGTA